MKDISQILSDADDFISNNPQKFERPRMENPLFIEYVKSLNFFYKEELEILIDYFEQWLYGDMRYAADLEYRYYLLYDNPLEERRWRNPRHKRYSRFEYITWILMPHECPKFYDLLINMFCEKQRLRKPLFTNKITTKEKKEYQEYIS